MNTARRGSRSWGLTIIGAIRHAVLPANGFFEVETARRVDQLGNMRMRGASMKRRTPDDELPGGAASIPFRLFRDEQGHWRIMSMIWDNEREGVAKSRRFSA